MTFSELGAETAYRSKFRNNSVFGDVDNAKFAYDYSIFSLATSYDYRFSRLTLSPFFNWGLNESAFNYENKYFKYGINLNYNKTKLSASYISIDKNALVAVFTDENVDMANVKGGQLELNHELYKNLSLNFNFTQLVDKQNDEQIESMLISATYWSKL